MVRVTLLVLVSILLTTPVIVQGAESVLINFEKDNDDRFILDGAVFVTDDTQVLSGSTSLLGDSRNSTDAWNEFFHTSPQVKFEPGNTYHVSFRYKIVDPGDRETRFYSLLRSRSDVEEHFDKYGDFWLWTREQGGEGTIHRIFEVTERDDWYFIIGILHEGVIVVDDIRITVCEDDIPGYGLPVKSHDTGLEERRKHIARVREKEGLEQTLKDMVIIWCNEGAGTKIIDARHHFVKEHNPDFVDWNPVGPLAQDYGVRTSRGGPEYQEFYIFEGPEVWNKRYELFGESGFAVSLDGTFIRDETWGEGGYFTCHNGDNWHNWFKDELVHHTEDCFAVCQDNIACAPFYKGNGCFCKPCLEKFRNWLDERYSSEELAAFGIQDVSAFDYQQRVLRYGILGDRALGDPVTREYIKFQFVSQLHAWANVVERVKSDAHKRGLPMPVYGNQIGAFGMWPFAVAISQFCDIIEIEEVTTVGDTIPNWSLMYKMGRAGSHEERPVWVRGPVYHEYKERTPQMSPIFWEVHMVQGLATGGARTISFGMNAPWTGDPDTLDFMDSPEIQDVWKKYTDMVHHNRGLFIHRESLAKVGLVYSLPTTMYRRYYPQKIDDHEIFQRFELTAWWLDDINITYDCVIFGHPNLFPTDADRLDRYDALILPSADALSDEQIALLRKFQERGGILIAYDPLGTLDENLNPRNADDMDGIEFLHLWNQRREVISALKSVSPVQIDAPERVPSNVWFSADGTSVDLHLVNYAADLSRDYRPQMSPFKSRVKMPEGFQPDSARLVQLDKPRRNIPFNVRGGWVEVEVPSFGAYAVVSFMKGDGLDRATREANIRREMDKREVRRIAREKNLY